MASYSITKDGDGIIFSVSGLSEGDNVRFFIRFADDENSVIYDADKNYATGSDMTHGVSLFPGTFTANVKVNDDWLGAKTFTIEDHPDPGETRPENWSWSGIIYSGCPLENLTAADWRSFQSRIDEFRIYKGIGAYGFTAPVSGETLLATLFKEAEAAIAEIPGSGTVPAGRELAMTYFDGLADALNAV